MPFPTIFNILVLSESDDWSLSYLCISPPYESSELLFRSFIKPSDKYSDSQID